MTACVNHKTFTTYAAARLPCSGTLNYPNGYFKHAITYLNYRVLQNMLRHVINFGRMFQTYDRTSQTCNHMFKWPGIGNLFYDFFCRWHSLMNRPCYNNLFQFSAFNRVSFTHWKHLEPRVNVFWYCFSVIKRYAK